MKTILEQNYIQARAAALEQIAWMNQKNLSDAERQGGVEYLRANPQTDAGRRFLGIESRLIKLAGHDDAAQEYIRALSAVVEEQFNTIHQLNAELREYRRKDAPPLEAMTTMDFQTYLQLMLLTTRIPKRVGAFLDLREGRRDASKLYAATTQPNLF